MVTTSLIIFELECSTPMCWKRSEYGLSTGGNTPQISAAFFCGRMRRVRTRICRVKLVKTVRCKGWNPGRNYQSESQPFTLYGTRLQSNSLLWQGNYTSTLNGLNYSVNHRFSLSKGHYWERLTIISAQLNLAMVPYTLCHVLNMIVVSKGKTLIHSCFVNSSHPQLLIFVIVGRLIALLDQYRDEQLSNIDSNAGSDLEHERPPRAGRKIIFPAFLNYGSPCPTWRWPQQP